MSAASQRINSGIAMYLINLLSWHCIRLIGVNVAHHVSSARLILLQWSLLLSGLGLHAVIDFHPIKLSCSTYVSIMVACPIEGCSKFDQAGGGRCRFLISSAINIRIGYIGQFQQ